jgi:hypothetical protein
MTQYHIILILLIFVILEIVKYKEEDGEDFLLCELCRITILCLQLLNGYWRHLTIRRLYLNSLLSSLIAMLLVNVRDRVAKLYPILQLEHLFFSVHKTTVTLNVTSLVELASENVRSVAIASTVSHD